MIRSVQLALLLVISNWIYGQNCPQKLQEVTRAFYQGNLRGIDDLIGPCLESGFNGEDKIDALKLLINTNLLLNDNAKADSYMFELLKFEPTYELRESDLVEFKSLYSTYSVDPKFSVGFNVGIQFPNYHITRHQSFASDATQEDYREKAGFQVGLTSEYRLWKNIELTSGLLLDKKSFNQSEDILFNSQRVSSDEREFRISLPLSIRYKYDLKSITPFIDGGISIDYLVKAVGDIDLESLPRSLIISRVDEPDRLIDQNLTSLHNQFGYALQIGTGLQKRINRGFFQLAITYKIGLSQVIDQNKLQSNDILYQRLAYVPNSSEINSLVLSISYFHSFYQAKKKS